VKTVAVWQLQSSLMNEELWLGPGAWVLAMEGLARLYIVLMILKFSQYPPLLTMATFDILRKSVRVFLFGELDHCSVEV
jgi:hypothetical protein